MKSKKKAQPKKVKENKQTKQEKRILKNIFMSAGILIFIILAGYLYIDGIRNLNTKE